MRFLLSASVYGSRLGTFTIGTVATATSAPVLRKTLRPCVAHISFYLEVDKSISSQVLQARQHIVRLLPSKLGHNTHLLSNKQAHSPATFLRESGQVRCR